MSPYYQDKYATIYHGDCRAILPVLAPVDHVITDPPYTQRTSVNISPRLTEIKAELNQGYKVKGIKAERIIKAGVRAEKQPKAILV